MKNLYLILTLLLSFQILGQQEDVPFDKRLFEDQKSEFDEAVREIKAGDFHFFDGSEDDLKVALNHYLDATKFNPYSSLLNYKIGICYLYSNKKYNSLEFLEFAHNVNPDVDPNINFYLAQAHHLQMNFDEAIKFYTIQKDIIGSKDQNQRVYINKKIRECRNGKKLVANPERVWIDNLGPSVNTEYSEYSPVISADNRVLFYTARRPDSYGGEKDNFGIYLEDVYYNYRAFRQDWKETTNIGSPVNTKAHDATVGLAPDGKSLFIYRSISGKNGDIYITNQKEDGTWEEPKSIGENINTKYHESSAALTFDEKILFFDSDQPGGEGQHDIYFSYWDEETKSWGERQNIGPKINTEFEEKGVFIDANGQTLYFSSDGHNNIGGLDIFKTIFDEETQEWSEPINLGYPINTPDDDVYFVVTGDKRYAYYSSYREDGFGEKDIYRITFLGDKKPPIIVNADLVASGFDTKLNQPLIPLFGEIDDLLAEKEKEKTEAHTSSKDKVDINTTEAFDPFDKKDDKKINVTLAPDPITVKGNVTDISFNKGMVAEVNIIDAVTNEKIKTIQTDPSGNFTVNLEPGKKYAFTASQPGYTIDSKTLNTVAKDKGTTKTLNFQLAVPVTDTEFSLKNLYFDFDKSELRDNSVLELDKLVQIMKEHPTMIIELSGHTDRRGSAEYNLMLSKKRAQISKRYLISKGINTTRIKTKGYGESKPEILGATISKMRTLREKENAHQVNRRTMIKILSK